MNIDMHFYGVYALARMAGITPQVARTIATASQFVDDADEKKPMSLDCGTVLPITTAHEHKDWENLDPVDQWRVWVPFHFLPGNAHGDPKSTHKERLICLRDTQKPLNGSANPTPAAMILKYALDHANEETPYAAYLVGIVTHVYADTFAHYGFTGISTEQNKINNASLDIDPQSEKGLFRYLGRLATECGTYVTGGLLEGIPIGHAPVVKLPDKPQVKWRFEFEDGRKMPENGEPWRDNTADYLDACEYLHHFFLSLPAWMKDSYAERQWDDGAAKIINGILHTEGTSTDHRSAWKKVMREEKLFPMQDGDSEVAVSKECYDAHDWDFKRIQNYFYKFGNLDGCPGALFGKAARIYRNYVTGELLYSLGLVL